MLNEATQLSAKADRRQYHVEIDDEICALDQISHSLEQLIRDAGGCPPVNEVGTISKDQLSDAPRPIPTLVELLNDGGRRIHSRRMDIEDKIGFLRELLF